VAKNECDGRILLTCPPAGGSGSQNKTET